jgi:hypothetical protein
MHGLDKTVRHRGVLRASHSPDLLVWCTSPFNSVRSCSHSLGTRTSPAAVVQDLPRWQLQRRGQAAEAAQQAATAVSQDGAQGAAGAEAHCSISGQLAGAPGVSCHAAQGRAQHVSTVLGACGWGGGCQL